MKCRPTHHLLSGKGIGITFFFKTHFSLKKALRAFRDGLRTATAQSGSVNVRLRELLALVEASLGGVVSAARLLAELNGTVGTLSLLYEQLERKIGTKSETATEYSADV